jgi:hypothetical protein
MSQRSCQKNLSQEQLADFQRLNQESLMKSKFRFAAGFAAIVAAMAISGCSTTKEPEHNQHHPGTTTAPTAGMMSPGAAGDQMAMMDMKAMCEMHRKMMSTKTPEEQKAMMDERMKSMSPEMMKKHMAMMQECK